MRNNQNRPGPGRHAGFPQTPRYSPPPAPPQETPVTRYVHPIQANPLYQEGPPLSSDPLVIILDTLARHTEMLEELLRRTDNNSTDTM